MTYDGVQGRDIPGLRCTGARSLSMECERVLLGESV